MRKHAKELRLRHMGFDSPQLKFDFYESDREAVEFFISKMTAIETPLFFKFTGTLAMALTTVFLILRYKYLNIKIEREGFTFQTNPFNKKIYNYSDIASCKEFTKVYRTRRFKSGGSHYYRDYFTFTDKSGKSKVFLYEKHLYKYEIYILKKRINAANATGTESYIYDDSLIPCEPEDIDLPSDKSDNGNHLKKSGGGLIILSVLTAVLLLTFLTKAMMPMISAGNNGKESVSQQSTIDHLEVKRILEEKAFNTVDMPTSYWFINEEKLMYVASGEKTVLKLNFMNTVTAKQRIWFITKSHMILIKVLSTRKERRTKESFKEAAKPLK